MRLHVDNLACRRAGRHVFSDVSFRVGPGEALLVTGRNGAGKSTLLGALAGLVGQESGTVRAEDVGDRTLPECLHVVGHRDALKAALTAAENLRFAASLLGSPGSSPDDALARVGLAAAASMPVAFLSAGQRRRVALARLIVARRPLWLLDEPLTALDAASQERVLELMREHLAGNGLVVAATHALLDLPGARELRLGPA